MHSAFWSSADIQTLSDDGKLLALYLLSCSHGTIAGVCRLPDGYVSEDLKWTSGRVSKGFDELFSKGFANRCEASKWVWIRKFLQWNAPENPNQWKAVWKVVSQIPGSCAWRTDFLALLSKLTGKEPPPEANPCETVSEPFRNLSSISTATASQQEEESRTVPQKRDPGPVERIFEHWQEEFGKKRAALDGKRRRTIEAALKLHDEATLRASISGYRNSPHHMGENERRTVYDDIELFLRDATHIENGLRFARGPPAPALSAVAQARQKLRESVNGNGRVVSEQSGQSEGNLGQVAGLLR